MHYLDSDRRDECIAWTMGALSRRGGAEAHDCPFAEGTALAAKWESGREWATDFPESAEILRKQTLVTHESVQRLLESRSAEVAPRARVRP